MDEAGEWQWQRLSLKLDWSPIIGPHREPSVVTQAPTCSLDGALEHISVFCSWAQNNGAHMPVISEDMGHLAPPSHLTATNPSPTWPDTQSGFPSQLSASSFNEPLFTYPLSLPFISHSSIYLNWQSYWNDNVSHTSNQPQQGSSFPVLIQSIEWDQVLFRRKISFFDQRRERCELAF